MQETLRSLPKRYTGGEKKPPNLKQLKKTPNPGVTEEPKKEFFLCLGLQHWHRTLEMELEKQAKAKEQTDLATGKQTELRHKARSD